jgi:heptosyltransferase-2
LVNNHKDIHRVISFDKSISKIKALKQTINEVRKVEYDEVFNLQRYFSSGLITLFTRAKVKVGFQSNPLSLFYNQKFQHEIASGKHEVERNLAMIQHHGAAESARPSLYPSKRDLAISQEFIKPKFYCIAPASVWYTKQLPKEKWTELLNGISDKVYILGGPDDKSLGDELIANSKNNLVENLCGKLSLLQSAALMKEANMNFVNDSGPLHLASAVNAPVVAFFCSTSPAFGFGPLSDQHLIIESKEELSCKPCGIHGYQSCPKKHFKCGYSIEIKSALSFISEL